MAKFEIQKPIGAAMSFSGGSDIFTPVVKVVQSGYYAAEVGDKELEITVPQRSIDTRVGRVQLSLDTLHRIAEWAAEVDYAKEYIF